MNPLISSVVATIVIYIVALSLASLEILGLSRDQVLIASLFLMVFYLEYCADKRFKNLEEWVGEPSFPSKKWVRKLIAGKPKVPAHEPSTSKEWPSFTKDFFDRSEDFVHSVNKWLAHQERDWSASPWRLQQLESTLLGSLRDRYSDSPHEGREYRIWFNDQPVGTLQLVPSFRDDVTATIEVEHARVFSLETIWDLMRTVGGQLHCNAQQFDVARQEMMFAAVTAIWSVGQNAEHNPALVFSLKGQLLDPQKVAELEARARAELDARLNSR